MICEQLEELKRVHKRLQYDHRVLRVAKNEDDEPVDELDFLIGPEPDGAIHDAIRAAGEAERENYQLIQGHIANCPVCGHPKSGPHLSD